MATVTPDRSVEQRREALELANDVRCRRAELKRDLKAGRESFPALLSKPPAYLDTAKVFDMLLAVPRFGPVKVARLLSRCGASPSKTFSGLSERQRLELVGLLGRGR